MNTTEKLAISLRLRELTAAQSSLFESLIDAESPRDVLGQVDALHSQAAELLALVSGMAREPGALGFASGQEVRLDELPGRTAAEDKASQRFVERRAG